jgi:hypothetical protein
MWTSRLIARILRATLLVLPLQLGATSMAAAADWVAADVRGTVLLLVDDKWQELTAGQVLPSPATLRTLGGGRLTIQSEGFAFALGGATALRLERAGTPTISHMAGIMAFAVAPPHRMVMATPSGAVSTGGGRGRLTIANGRAVIELDAGTATAVSPDGNAIELAAGQSLDLGTPDGAAATGQAGEILPRASSESDPGHGNASDGEARANQQEATTAAEAAIPAMQVATMLHRARNRQISAARVLVRARQSPIMAARAIERP